VRDKLRRGGLAEEIGEANIYRSISDAAPVFEQGRDLEAGDG
jgi:hypothetical protein